MFIKIKRLGLIFY